MTMTTSNFAKPCHMRHGVSSSGRQWCETHAQHVTRCVLSPPSEHQRFELEDAMALKLTIVEDREAAEQEAWLSLSRYKFDRFGYWCAKWVQLNALLPAAERRGNPWRELVRTAKAHQRARRA